MEKRSNRRIPLNREIVFSWDNSNRYGTLTNCSEKGMYIETTVSFPFGEQYEVVIPMKNDALKLPVRVVRIDRSGYLYKGMAVELLQQPRQYLDFIINIEFVMNHNKDGKA